MKPSAWLAVAIVLLARDAASHATLIATMPADGERLQTSPAALVFEFDEPVVPLSITIVDGRGQRLAVGSRAEVEGERVRLPLEPPLTEGGYVASYRIVSADSHPISGAVAFSIGAHDIPAHADPASSRPTAIDVGLRALQLAASLITAGAVIYIAVIAASPGLARLIALGAIGVLLASLLAIGRHAIALAADDSGHAVSHVSYAMGPLAAVVGAVGILLTASRSGASKRGAILASAVLLPASLVLGGHALTASWGIVASAALFVHLAGAAFWAGSLAALYATLRTSDSTFALRRFSSIAQFAVPIGIAAGLVFAALEIRTVENLLSSEYGRLAIAKLMLTAALLSLATLNRFVLLPSLERGDVRAHSRLGGSIAGEIAIVALLIVLGATLGMTAPPRNAINEQTLEAGDLRARVSASATGTIDLRFERAGQVVDPAEVSIEARHAVAAIGPLERSATRVEPGLYRAEDVPLGIPGTWDVTVRVRIDEFTRSEFRTTIRLR